MKFNFLEHFAQVNTVLNVYKNIFQIDYLKGIGHNKESISEILYSLIDSIYKLTTLYKGDYHSS